jgi:hypothetical protein
VRTGAGDTVGALIITGIGLYLASGAHSAEAEHAKGRASSAYEHDLRRRLGLCPRDGELVDCGGAR